jgi:hypothetical protein
MKHSILGIVLINIKNNSVFRRKQQDELRFNKN